MAYYSIAGKPYSFQAEVIDNLKRIRISSIEITELNDKFLDELKVNKKIVDQEEKYKTIGRLSKLIF